MGALSLGLSTAAIGMLVVFFGLAVLIGCIYVMALLTGNKKKETKAAPVPAPAPAEVTEEAEEENDDAVIAAITAAVYAVMQSEGNANKGFVVRRVKRCHTAPAWQRGGREEQMYSHM